MEFDRGFAGMLAVGADAVTAVAVLVRACT